jgi:RHS repeat-associated protein
MQKMHIKVLSRKIFLKNLIEINEAYFPECQYSTCCHINKLPPPPCPFSSGAATPSTSPPAPFTHNHTAQAGIPPKPWANMVSSIIGAFVGPAPATFDGKANLLTNGQTIINTTAFNNAIQHQQQNTPANNTPRAFLKALFFDEQMNLTDSALIRISRGANTIHTYSGQRTAQQNGYVYVYATNEIVRFAHTIENNKQVHGQIDRFAHTIKNNKQGHGQSGFDVWFDDLFVTHRTGPLLQACPDESGKAHFYPFGMEITPLSSKAVLKTPNERMLQQNEWDEEFGLDLHDFDARMYDASIGRFWGVDVLAHKQYALTPYHYGANNPVMMRDPDGRLFFLPALLIGGKVLAKAKIAKGMIAAFKASKVGKAVTAVKTATAKVSGKLSAGKFGKFMKGNFRPIAAGTRNLYNNRTALSGGDWLQGLGLFAAGFAGGKLAMVGYNPNLLGEAVTFGSEFGFEALGAFMGGMATMSVNAIDGDMEDDLMQSFARGAGAVISSKFDEKAFKKANRVDGFDLKKFANGTIFSSAGAVANGYGEYGQKYAEAYGGGIWWQMALGGLLGGAATGGMDGWGLDLSN